MEAVDGMALYLFSIAGIAFVWLGLGAGMTLIASCASVQAFANEGLSMVFLVFATIAVMSAACLVVSSAVMCFVSSYWAFLVGKIFWLMHRNIQWLMSHL